jgi:hypothetical protein
MPNEFISAGMSIQIADFIIRQNHEDGNQTANGGYD